MPKNVCRIMKNETVVIYFWHDLPKDATWLLRRSMKEYAYHQQVITGPHVYKIFHITHTSKEGTSRGSRCDTFFIIYLN